MKDKRLCGIVQMKAQQIVAVLMLSLRATATLSTVHSMNLAIIPIFGQVRFTIIRTLGV